MSKGLRALLIIVCVILVIVGLMSFAGSYKSNPASVIKYDTDNPYIMESTDISAHRSGGGIEPEESLRAFRNCAENPNFSVSVFEFDLHITKDDVLILLHDDTLERTTDCENVLGDKDARPENYTYDELRQLNIGVNFKNDKGEKPYAELSGKSVPDDLKIMRVEDALDYLTSVGDYKFVIEIKNGGDLGKKGVDILHKILVERNLVDRVFFGTFHGEISEYVDENYPDMIRSTGVKEFFKFFFAAITDSKSYEPPCSVLQIPYCKPFKNLGINTATAKVINYAHKHNLAVQYWTINDEEDMEYLLRIGADCIMSDYPDKLYNVKQYVENVQQ